MQGDFTIGNNNAWEGTAPHLPFLLHYDPMTPSFQGAVINCFTWPLD